MSHSTLSRATAVLALVAVSALTACSSDSGGGDDGNASTDDSAASSGGPGALPEADLSGVPDVIAEVNGEDIDKEEFTRIYQGVFQQAASQSAQTGTDVDQKALKEQTAEDMVDSALLVQAADDAKISVGDDEVIETLEELATGGGASSVDEFYELLKAQGYEAKEVRSEVKKQLKVEGFIAESGDLKTPTEKEQKDLYDELTGDMSGGGGEDPAAASIPPFKDVQQQLEQQLKQEAQAEVAQDLIKDLRKDADITINI